MAIEIQLSKTQLIVIGTVYGFVFSIPTFGDVFLQYIAPILLRDTNNPVIPLGIAIVWTLVFISSLGGIYAILNNIIKTQRMLSGNRFNNYMISLGVVFVVAIFSALILRKLIFG